MTADQVQSSYTDMQNTLDGVTTDPSTPTPSVPATPHIGGFSQDSGTAGDHLTNDDTPTLTGTAVANSTVTIYDGTTPLGTTTSSGTGAWTFTAASLDDGVHSFTATVADGSGNTSNSSAALPVTIDTTAPDAPAIASGGGDSSDSTPTLTGTAEANSTVTVYDGNTSLGTTKAAANGTWTFTTAALADGAHSFTATASDAAGNVSTHSSAVDVAIDTSQPGQQARWCSRTPAATSTTRSGAPTASTPSSRAATALIRSTCRPQDRW